MNHQGGGEQSDSKLMNNKKSYVKKIIQNQKLRIRHCRMQADKSLLNKKEYGDEMNVNNFSFFKYHTYEIF